MKVISLHFYYTLPYAISPLNIRLFKLKIVFIPRLVKCFLFPEMPGKAVHGDALKGLRVQYEAISVIGHSFRAVSGPVH